jgi:uncharacterized protein YjbJ (UPF0337 family)
MDSFQEYASNLSDTFQSSEIATQLLDKLNEEGRGKYAALETVGTILGTRALELGISQLPRFSQLAGSALQQGVNKLQDFAKTKINDFSQRLKSGVQNRLETTKDQLRQKFEPSPAPETQPEEIEMQNLTPQSEEENTTNVNETTLDPEDETPAVNLEIPDEIAQQYGRGAFSQLVARGGLDDTPQQTNEPVDLNIEPTEVNLMEQTPAQPEDVFEQVAGSRAFAQAISPTLSSTRGQLDEGLLLGGPQGSSVMMGRAMNEAILNRQIQMPTLPDLEGIGNIDDVITDEN